MRNSQSGQGLVEYALILILVAVVVIVMLALLGPSIGRSVSRQFVLEDPVCTNGEPEITDINYNNGNLVVTYRKTNESLVTKGFVYYPSFGNIDWSKSCK